MVNARSMLVSETSEMEAKKVARKAILIPDYGVVMPESANPAKSGKIVLPTMDGLCFEKIKHITCLEASGNYTMLHFSDKRQLLVCKTLRDVEMMLPDDVFVRIHRSHTVHLRHIKKYVRGKGGYVVLENGVSLAVSAGQKDLFLEVIKKHFGY